MESNVNNILSLIQSNNPPSIAEGLHRLVNNCKEETFIKVISNLNLVELFTSKANIKNKKIVNFLPDILIKKSIYINENIIESYSINKCGGCFLCSMWHIVHFVPSLKKKYYAFITNFLGDYEGKILEEKSFEVFTVRAWENFDINSKEIEYCKRMKKSVITDYIIGMGRLFKDNKFIEKARDDPEEMNKKIEDFIKKQDEFNEKTAEVFLSKL